MLLQSDGALARFRLGYEADLRETGTLHGIDRAADAPIGRVDIATNMHFGQVLRRQIFDTAELQDLAVKRLESIIETAGGVENLEEEDLPEVHIRGDINTPYQCIGGVIYTMQYAGFQKIGFISEPAPGSGTLGRL